MGALVPTHHGAASLVACVGEGPSLGEVCPWAASLQSHALVLVLDQVLELVQVRGRVRGLVRMLRWMRGGQPADTRNARAHAQLSARLSAKHQGYFKHCSEHCSAGVWGAACRKHMKHGHKAECVCLCL